MKNVALILAKKGSIGLPDKNMLNYKGKPLVEHTIVELQESKCFSAIYVSTNCSRIAETAERLKVNVIKRADELAHNSRYVDSVNHAVSAIEEKAQTITIPMVVQPLREAGIFQRMLAMHADDVDSIVTTTHFESSVDWIYQKEQDSQQLRKVKNISYSNTIARQDNLMIIDNAIVSFTYNSWKKSAGMTPWPYLGNNILAVEQQYENSHCKIDINNPEDAEWLKFISTYKEWNNKKNHE